MSTDPPRCCGTCEHFTGKVYTDEDVAGKCHVSKDGKRLWLWVTDNFVCDLYEFDGFAPSPFWPERWDELRSRLGNEKAQGLIYREEDERLP